MAQQAGTTTASCGWPGCNKGSVVLESSLKTCARCKRTKYCSKNCQSAAWKLHKLVCVGHEIPRHQVDSMTIEAIIDTITLAQPGDVILIPSGQYNSSQQGDETKLISITKPLTIIGDGMTKVTLCCDLHVEDEGKVGGKFTVSNLTVKGIVRTRNVPGDINFLSVMVHCPPAQRDTKAFELTNCKGKVLLTCCDIIGGVDGLALTESPKVHIHETDIMLAHARGIFANDYFVIEDSSIYNCGAYGIKGRVGWREKGKNDIQPGPWDDVFLH